MQKTLIATAVLACLSVPAFADDAGVVVEAVVAAHEADDLTRLDFAGGSILVARRPEAIGHRAQGFLFLGGKRAQTVLDAQAKLGQHGIGGHCRPHQHDGGRFRCATPAHRLNNAAIDGNDLLSGLGHGTVGTVLLEARNHQHSQHQHQEHALQLAGHTDIVELHGYLRKHRAAVAPLFVDYASQAPAQHLRRQGQTRRMDW